jgi:hypothetical protein
VLIAAPEVDVATRAAAADWLQKVDKANYSGSWAAASMLKAAVSVQAWEKAAESVRAPLGALQKRIEKSANATNSFPRRPRWQIRRHAVRDSV